MTPAKLKENLEVLRFIYQTITPDRLINKKEGEYKPSKNDSEYTGLDEESLDAIGKWWNGMFYEYSASGVFVVVMLEK